MTTLGRLLIFRAQGDIVRREVIEMSESFVFRPLERGAKGARTTDPLVSMHKGGALAINRAAFEMIGSPAFVSLLVDEGKKAFAVCPASKGDSNAYPTRKQKTSTGVVVSGRKLAKVLGLDGIDAARRFTPKKEGQMLVIVLSESRQPQEDRDE